MKFKSYYFFSLLFLNHVTAYAFNEEFLTHLHSQTKFSVENKNLIPVVNPLSFNTQVPSLEQAVYLDYTQTSPNELNEMSLIDLTSQPFETLIQILFVNSHFGEPVFCKNIKKSTTSPNCKDFLSTLLSAAEVSETQNIYLARSSASDPSPTLYIQSADEPHSFLSIKF